MPDLLCPWCLKEFANSKSKSQHVRKNAGTQTCQICGATVVTRQQIKDHHDSTHPGKRMFATPTLRRAPDCLKKRRRLRFVDPVSVKTEPGEPSTSRSDVSNPAAPAKVATGKVATGKVATGKAATGKAATGKAATGKAATGKAATGKPAKASTSSVAKPATGKAATAKAATGKAGTSKPAEASTSSGSTKRQRTKKGPADQIAPVTVKPLLMQPVAVKVEIVEPANDVEPGPSRPLIPTRRDFKVDRAAVQSSDQVSNSSSRRVDSRTSLDTIAAPELPLGSASAASLVSSASSYEAGLFGLKRKVDYEDESDSDESSGTLSDGQDLSDDTETESSYKGSIKSDSSSSASESNSDTSISDRQAPVRGSNSAATGIARLTALAQAMDSAQPTAAREPSYRSAAPRLTLFRSEEETCAAVDIIIRQMEREDGRRRNYARPAHEINANTAILVPPHMIPSLELPQSQPSTSGTGDQQLLLMMPVEGPINVAVTPHSMEAGNAGAGKIEFKTTAETLKSLKDIRAGLAKQIGSLDQLILLEKYDSSEKPAENAAKPKPADSSVKPANNAAKPRPADARRSKSVIPILQHSNERK